jgi:hypothetical protein
MDKVMVYTEKMIDDLTNGKVGVYTKHEVGEKINILQKLKEEGTQVTIYNNKSGTKKYDQHGIMAPATNEDTSEGREESYDIYLQNGGGKTSIFNEIGDIFFKAEFNQHQKMDTQKILKENLKTKDLQRAYLNVYHELYQEKFSYNLQRHAGKLMNEK